MGLVDLLGKAALVGIVGSVLGVGVALLAAPLYAGTAAVVDAVRAAGPLFAVGVIGSAPIVTTLAAWLPSLGAAMEDPASVLSEE